MKIKFFLGVLALSLIPYFTNAAAVSLSVQPAQVEYTSKPGAINKSYLSVINKSNSSVKLKVTASDFKFVNERGDVDFYIANSDSALTWLTPQYVEINIPPYGTKTVEYIISIPKGTKPGGHLGAIIFELAKDKKFGTLFYLNVVDAGITTGGTITDFSTPKFQYAASPKLNLTVKNLGNANLIAKGTVTFSDWQGKKIAQFDTYNIITAPNNSRNFGVNWDRRDLFGFYKAQISITNLMRSDQKFSAETWFIFLPWQKIVIFVPLLLLVLIALIYIFVKMRQNKKDLLNPSIKFLKTSSLRQLRKLQ